MSISSRIIVMLVCSILCLHTLAQTDYAGKNIRYLDSVEQSYRKYRCNGVLVDQADHGKGELKIDVPVIRLLNEMMDTGFVVNKLGALPDGWNEKNLVIKPFKNGLITTLSIKVQGVYLRADVTIDEIDGKPIRQKCAIYSFGSVLCGDGHQDMINFRVFKEVFAKNAHFPIRMFDDHLLCTQSVPANIQGAALRNKGYRFFLKGTSPELDRIEQAQFNSDSLADYRYGEGDKYIVWLLANNQLDVIKDLLYSPNYCFSVNAMEAVSYLESEGKIALDSQDKARVTAIKEASYTIRVRRANDVYQDVEGYRELKVKEQRVMEKYKKADNK